MDLQSLEYFLEVVREGNITLAAKRLYMSQQTLSNHLLRLENELGVTLFTRRPAIRVTYAGEQVLLAANEILTVQKNLMEKLSMIRADEKGVLEFGASPNRINGILPAVLATFSSKYPNIELRITDEPTSVLTEKVIQDTLDLALVIQGSEHPLIISEPVLEDEIYLCVCESLLEKYYEGNVQELIERSASGARLEDFKDIPFCTLDSSLRLGSMVTNAFVEAGVRPRIYMRCKSMRFASRVGQVGLAAFFYTKSCLLDPTFDHSSDFCTFPLLYKGRPLTMSLCLIRNRNRQLAGYTEFFYNQIFNYLSKLGKDKVPSQQKLV